MEQARVLAASRRMFIDGAWVEASVALAKRIRTGVVWINNGTNLLDAPFGGFKESSLGREGGRFGIEEYPELQQIAWKT